MKRFKALIKGVCRWLLLIKFGRRLSCGLQPSPRLLWCLHIEKGSRAVIGDNAVIERGAHIYVGNSGYLEVGDCLYMNWGASITALHKIQIGNHVLMGPNAMIFDHDHDYSSSNPGRTYKFGDVSIGDEVWLCAGCVITRATSIGNRSIIAANAVVCDDIPSCVLAAGVPAANKHSIVPEAYRSVCE